VFVADAVVEYFQEACRTVWPLEKIATRVCRSGESDSDGGYVPFLAAALVVCDRPKDKYIPRGKQLERLKEVMASEGFEDAPGWFLPA